MKLPGQNDLYRTKKVSSINLGLKGANKPNKGGTFKVTPPSNIKPLAHKKLTPPKVVLKDKKVHALDMNSIRSKFGLLCNKDATHL